MIPDTLRLVKPLAEDAPPPPKSKKNQVAPPPPVSELRRVGDVDGKPAYEWSRWYTIAHHPDVGYCFQNIADKKKKPFIHGWIAPTDGSPLPFLGDWIRGDPRTREPIETTEDCLANFRIESK